MLNLWLIECKIKKQYLPQIKLAHKKRDYKTANELQEKYNWELLEIEEARKSILQDKLIKKARSLTLPIPTQAMKKDHEGDYEDENENWYFGSFGEFLLKDHALTNLRREINREIKESRELWIPIISVLTALIGATAALSSIWLTWFSKP